MPTPDTLKSLEHPFLELSRRDEAKAFTVIEILVVIAIVAVLAALLFPAMSASLDRANDTKCISNLRQIGTAVQLYASDNNGDIVPGFARDTSGVPIPGISWSDRLTPYVYPKPGSASIKGRKDWQCPNADGYQINTGGRISWAINYRIAYPGSSGQLRTRFVSLPAGRRFVLVADQPMLNNDYISENSFGPDPTRPKEGYFRHNNKIHVLWTDLSVSPASYEELMTNRSNLDKSLWKYPGAIGN
ncbi:MAG: type II secretion system protein [Spartobacteria bacterium]